MMPQRLVESNPRADDPRSSLTLRAIVHVLIGAAIAMAATACEVVDSKSAAKKQDTTTAPAVVPESARGAVATTDSSPATPVTPG